MFDIRIKVQVMKDGNWVSLYRGDLDQYDIAAQVYENAVEAGFETRGLEYSKSAYDGTLKWRPVGLPEIREEAACAGINPLEGLIPED